LVPRLKRLEGKTESTAQASPTVFCPFRKHPRWLQLWMYSKWV